MAYSFKDVDAAEALVRSLRPDAVISRDDYDWSLAIAAKDMKSVAVILFQLGDETRPEITSDLEEVRYICFFIGTQWSAEDIQKMKAKAKPGPLKINRIH